MGADFWPTLYNILHVNSDSNIQRRDKRLKIGEGVRERDVEKIRQGVKMAVKARLPDVVFSGQLNLREGTISPFDYAVDEKFVKGVEIMLKVCMLRDTYYYVCCITLGVLYNDSICIKLCVVLHQITFMLLAAFR